MSIIERITPSFAPDGTRSGPDVSGQISVERKRQQKKSIHRYLSENQSVAIPLLELDTAVFAENKIGPERIALVIREVQIELTKKKSVDRIDFIYSGGHELINRDVIWWKRKVAQTELQPLNALEPSKSLSQGLQTKLEPLFAVDITEENNELKLHWRLTRWQKQLLVHLAQQPGLLFYDTDITALDQLKGDQIQFSETIKRDVNHINALLAAREIPYLIYQVDHQNGYIFDATENAPVWSLSQAETEKLRRLPDEPKDLDSPRKKVMNALRYTTDSDRPGLLGSLLNRKERQLLVYLAMNWYKCVSVFQISTENQQFKLNDILIKKLNRDLLKYGLAIYYYKDQESKPDDKIKPKRPKKINYLSHEGAFMLGLTHIKGTEITVTVYDMSSRRAHDREVQVIVGEYRRLYRK